MNNKKILVLFAALLFIIPLAIGISYPTLTGYVTDNANIITPEYKQKITDLANSINKNTTVEIAVLTVDSLEGDTPENYALNVFRQNGVGKKDNNNGLLILVSKNDRKYKFETGYGLEGTIPDAMKVPIGDKIITPNFRKGDYGKGIYESMIVIEGLVTNNTEVLSQYGLSSNSESSEVGDVGIIFLFIGIILVAMVFYFLYSLRNGSRTVYSPPDYTRPSVPTYRSSPSSYSRSSSSSSSNSSKRRSSTSSGSSNYGGSSYSHSSHSSGFGGFGGGRSGGGGFGGGW